MPNLPNVGAAKTGLQVAETGYKAGRHLVGLEVPFRRFWVWFAARVEAERFDLPWDVVNGWRLDPAFHGAVEALLTGSPGRQGQADADVRWRGAPDDPTEAATPSRRPRSG